MTEERPQPRPALSDLDIALKFGGQLRAGKPMQRNPWPGTAHKAPGWRALFTRAVRRLLESSK